MKVGDTIWRFDINRRVYAKDAEGHAVGGPIHREHWSPATITAETRSSWIAYGGKCPKKGPHPGWAFSESEIDDDCWIMDYRYRISRDIDRCQNAAILRQVAELLGWEPKV